MVDVGESYRDPAQDARSDDEIRNALTPRLLVSVRDADEAVAAVAGGADIVDLKEPSLGSLGPVGSEIAIDVVERFKRSKIENPLSMAMGELASDFARFASLRSVLGNFRFAKVGLAGTANILDWRNDWRAWCDGLPANVDAVFVLYVDWRDAKTAPPSEMLHFATVLSGEGRAKGVLFDTYGKGSGDLFSCMDAETLSKCMQQARDAGLWTALAGSLSAQTVAKATFMRTDVVAVRGAVCRGGRNGVVQGDAVRNLRTAIAVVGRQKKSDF